MSRLQKPTEDVTANSSIDTDTDNNDSPISRLRKQSQVPTANKRDNYDEEQVDDSVENILVEELSFSDFQDNFSTHRDQVSVVVQENNSNGTHRSNKNETRNSIRGKELAMLATKQPNLKSNKHQQFIELKIQRKYNTRRATENEKKENLKRAIENGPLSRRTRSRNLI